MQACQREAKVGMFPQQKMEVYKIDEKCACLYIFLISDYQYASPVILLLRP